MAFMIKTTFNGAPMTFRPHETHEALSKAAQLGSEGHYLITLRDLDRGVTLDIERFMRGNPSDIQ